jgi:hypothetical protein
MGSGEGKGGKKGGREKQRSVFHWEILEKIRGQIEVSLESLTLNWTCSFWW